MNNTKQFALVVRQGLLGAIIGLFAGLVLGIVIYAILVLSALVLSSASGDFTSEFPPQIVLMLSMGWGVVLGGIFGGVAALKR